MSEIKKSGMIAIIGRPNVGKSTLLNRILQKKIAITCRKPQTTRHNLLGIKTVDDCQMVFVDTPGIHQKQQKLLNKFMNKQAKQALHGVEVVYWLVEAGKLTSDDRAIAQLLSADAPVFLVVNKTDKVKDKNLLLPFIDECKELAQIAKIIPISAQTGDQVDTLLEATNSYLPEGPQLFPDGMDTDKPREFIASEFLRERLMYQLGDELPYALSIAVELMQETDGILHVHLIVWVDKESHKGMVIGKRGEVLKKASMEARIALENYLQQKIYLRAWVKVKSGWSDSAIDLRGLGYTNE